ncbi:MAG: Gx transporter family protein [Bullifex sp.]
MPLHSERKRLLAYLTALSLFFAVAENMLVHPVPFLRYGFAVIPLLFALPYLSFYEYMLLLAGKWLASTLSQGTLLSPFSIIALSSTFASGLVMYILYKAAGRYISVYTISLASSIVSAVTQIHAASLFLGDAVLRLIIVMLPLSEVTGLVTAFLSRRLELSANPPAITGNDEREDDILTIILHLIYALCSFFVKNVPILLILFIIAITCSLIQKRKVFWMNYIITFAAVVFCNLLSPNGEVLFSFITKGALEEGIIKALRLIVLVAVSQSFAALRIKGGEFLSSVFAYNSAFLSAFSKKGGNVFKRLQEALSLRDAGSFVMTDGKKSGALVPLLILGITAEVTAFILTTVLL